MANRNLPATDRAIMGPFKGSPTIFTDPMPRLPTYTSGTYNFTPAATATDFAKLQMNGYGKMASLSKVRISGTATSAAIVDVLLQRSTNGGGGTATQAIVGKLDNRVAAAHSAFYTYSANRSSGGNGIDSTRHLIRAGKLHLGKADGTVLGNALEWTFDATNRPTIRDLTEWLVLNWTGAAVPSGTSLDIEVEWVEEAQPPTIFGGDSTTSNASTMFDVLGMQGGLSAITNFFNGGSNGYRLQDALLNTNSIPYPLVGGAPLLSRYNFLPGVFVLCYGINDMREGAKTRNELISMIDAALYAIKYGTQSGATYTSPVGANTVFTWPGTVDPNPDCRVILWSPNMITTDGNGSSFVTLTGRFSAMTLAQAAQTMTDDLREAYEFFRTSNDGEMDPRVFRIVHKQDITGTTSTTVANSGQWAFDNGEASTNASLMTDILHPNARLQRLTARQIAPVIRDAISDIYATELI